MVENEKSNFIASSFSLLLKAWEKWDVKGMVLFSLTLQIILSVLGRRRKYKMNYFFKAILWLAYLGADWIAIVTLGKLSDSYAEATATNILRAYWAPLLLVHLGGPDTITAYAFEDNKLWIRHLVILVVKVILVIYVVCLSWTFSWLSFFTLPLILAGIIKYVEKILCLKLNNSQKTKPIISSMFNLQDRSVPAEFQDHSVPVEFQDHSVPAEFQALHRFHGKNPTVLASYLLFTIMRPDVNNYLFCQDPLDLRTRIQAYLWETACIRYERASEFVETYILMGPREAIYEMFSIQLGFMFDVVYTKASLIYTKLGCFLRLTSFTSLFSVLLLFFINITNEQNFHGSRIDIAITGILLSGAIAQELYAVWVMLSSDWATLVAEFHHNVLVRNMFKVTLNCCPWLLHQRKRWSNQMGQFDLLEYCWRSEKRKANQSHGFLSQIISDCKITEMWHKYRFIKFVEPSFFSKESLYGRLCKGIISKAEATDLKITRGAKALRNFQQFDQLKWSIELDFDHSIIIWHLATSVCYLQENNQDNEDMKNSKYISDYMMYLLITCPALLLSEHSKSFWLDRTYDNLKELVSPATAIQKVFHEQDLESRERTIESLKGDVLKLACYLNQSNNKWKMIKHVWIEILVHAALSSQQINHLKQLVEGIEFLSHIWLLVSTSRIRVFELHI